MILEEVDRFQLGQDQIMAVGILDSRAYLAASWNGRVAARDPGRRKTEEVVVADGSACSGLAVASSDAGIAVTTFAGGVHLLDPETLHQRKQVRLSQSALTCAAISTDRQIFAFGGRRPEIVCVRASDLSTICRFDGHHDWLEALAFQPESRILAAGDQTGDIRIWSIREQKERHLLQGHRGAVMALAWSPAGAQIASGGHDKIIRLWNPEDGSMIGQLTGHKSTVRGLAFLGGGQTLISASQDRTIRFWDVAARMQTASFTTDDQWLTALALDNRGKLMVTGSLVGVVRSLAIKD